MGCVLPSPPPLGLYDSQYEERTGPECRGRLRTDGEGKYGYRAVVPAAYFIPCHVGSSFLYVFPRSLTVADLQNRARRASCFSHWDDTTLGRVTYTW